MTLDVMALMVVGLSISFLPGAEPVPCPSSTVAVNVTSTVDVQNLTTALNCTGEGAFDITWYTSLTVTQRIDVSDNKNVTVTGNGFPIIRGVLADDGGAGATVDAGAGNSTGLFSVSDGSTLRLNDLVLEGGNAENGGAIDVLSSSSLFVFGCTFADNNATNGGAISATTSNIYVADNTSFDDNSAQSGGAIYLYGNSFMEIDGSTSFLNNHARGSGGALYASSNSEIDAKRDETFSNNSAEIDGGAIYLSARSSVEFDSSAAFLNNFAKGDGGVMYAYDSFVGIDGDGTFYNNSAGKDGGAIYLYHYSSMEIDGNTSFTSNSATRNGGALGADTNVSSSINGNTSFFNNVAEGSGGALYGSTSCSIDVAGDSVFDSNIGGSDGGAVYLHLGSSMDIDGSTSFLNNAAGDDGGAVYMTTNSYMQMDGSVSFLNNIAGDGGAVRVFTNASAIFNGNASFVGNVARGDGGALNAYTTSSFNFAGTSVLDSNTAAGDGGAIHLYDRSSVQVDGSIYLVNNVAGDDGGALSSIINGSIIVNGNISFINNYATATGGAVYATEFTAVELVGSSIFDSNLADNDGGAIYMSTNTYMHFDGSTSFISNTAGDDGGAVALIEYSWIDFDGDTLIYNNSAVDNAGGLLIARDTSVNINGKTMFLNNSARNSGGALYVSDSELHINGNTSITYNSANSPGGGALYASQADIKMDGFTSITNNTGYDGGAILSQESEIHVTGNATFAYNSASRDGGAIKMTDSSLFIAMTRQEVEVDSSSTNNLMQGGIVSAPQFESNVIDTISFIGNTAFDYGGAISIANPDEVNVSDATFTLNEAESGGAVGLTSTSWATTDFKRCRFESNTGTRGGALYLDGEGRRFVQDSSFRLNVAHERGGAIFNTGTVGIKNTVFVENAATDGGLAIQNLESTSAVALFNVIFDGNILGCAAQTYSYTQDTSDDSCRFELACDQCLDGCDSDLSNVDIDRDTYPTCEPIPEGVWPSSTATTLQTFDIKAGYFRISADSPEVIECYQEDACVGGIDPNEYCAIGYTGPYCAVCTEGYAPGSSRRCHECSGENTGFAVVFSITVLLLVLLVIVLVVGYLVQRVGDGAHQAQEQPRRWRQGKLSRFRKFFVKAVPLSSIRIVVVVVQIVVQFTDIAGAVYPDEYESFLAGMALLNFDIGSLLSSSCLVGTNFYDTLVLVTLAPIVLLLGLAGAFLVAKMRNRNVPSAGPIVKHKHLSVVLFVVFFVYSSVSFTIFQTFVCDSLDDGKAYLRADYSITCFTETHTAYRIYASLMVFIYPVGIPALIAFWLVRHSEELEDPDRETMMNLKPYRCIWAGYKPSCCYYEVVECGRRIVLTGAAVFIFPGSAEQVAVVLFFAVVFMFVSESLSPFNLKSDMWLYRWGNGIILASMYVAFLLKVDLATEESDSSSAITALLIAAHVFMIFTVAMQAFLLMRGLCASKAEEEMAPSQHGCTVQDDLGNELEASANMQHVCQ